MGLFGAYIIEGQGESETQKKYVRSVSRRSKAPNDTDLLPDIPLLISDKMFTQKGNLYYESKFDTANGGGRQPEFFGNTITVNGKAWPHFDVDRRVYRFRILNTSSSRFYRLALARWKNGEVDLSPISDSTVVQIGTEGGLLMNDITKRYITPKEPLTLAPGERADVTINFSEFSASLPESLVLLNLATGDPYQEKDENKLTIESVSASKKMYENFVMQFRVKPQVSPDYMTNIDVVRQINAWQKDPVYQKMTIKLDMFNKGYQLKNFNLSRQIFRQNTISGTVTTHELPDKIITALGSTTYASVYSLSIVEAGEYAEFPTSVKAFYEVHPEMKKDIAFPMAFLNASEWNMEANVFRDTNTYASDVGDGLKIKEVDDQKTEIWKITNYTGDTHPIHIHLNRFRILGRMKENYDSTYTSDPREGGWKDVVRVKPDTFTTYLVIMYALSKDERTNLAQFVYHCHILEHEDVSMMRRLLVRKPGTSTQPQVSGRQKPGALYDRFGIPLCYTLTPRSSRLPTKPSGSFYRTVRN